MVGASQSIGLANAVTNAIVADVLHDFADKLEGCLLYTSLAAQDKQTENEKTS